MRKVKVVWGLAILLAVVILATSIPNFYLVVLGVGVPLFLGVMSFSIKSQFFLKSVLKTTENNVLLSFDDGPDPVNTPQILDILKEHDATALFFLIGKKVNGNEALVRRIHEEGHLLGSHSFSHDPKMGFWSKLKVTTDISDGHEGLLTVVPEAGNLYRPPFGVINPTIAMAIKNCGLQSVGWTVRSFDTVKKDPEKLLNRLKRKIKINGSDIVLLHDTQSQTVSILDSLIVDLKKRGLTLKACLKAELN